MPDYLEIRMKQVLLGIFSVLMLAASLNAVAFDGYEFEIQWQERGGAARFPSGPNVEMTPGSVCTRADRYRYPEHVAYCERDVDTQTKWEIIRRYDRQLGYQIQSMPRGQFKIDHFIPLCAGGSNDISNLWPQHRTIYELTDPMEPLLCQRMSEGKLKQRDAIELVKLGKTDLSKIPAIMARLNNM